MPMNWKKEKHSRTNKLGLTLFENAYTKYGSEKIKDKKKHMNKLAKNPSWKSVNIKLRWMSNSKIGFKRK